MTLVATQIGQRQDRSQPIAHRDRHHGLFEFPGCRTQSLEKVKWAISALGAKRFRTGSCLVLYKISVETRCSSLSRRGRKFLGEAGHINWRQLVDSLPKRTEAVHGVAIGATTLANTAALCGGGERIMTMPAERTRALHWAGGFLIEIARNAKLPGELRQQAVAIARHSPTVEYIETLVILQRSSEPDLGLGLAPLGEVSRHIGDLFCGPLTYATRLAW